MNLMIVISAASLQTSTALSWARTTSDARHASLPRASSSRRNVTTSLFGTGAVWDSIPHHEQSQGTWQYQGWWDTFRPLYVPQGTELALEPSLAHMMDLRIRDNVCIGTGNGRVPGNGTKTKTGVIEKMAVEGLLSMKAVPTGYRGPVVPGAVVILTMHHFSSYRWQNIEHLAEAVLPIFDTLSQLHNHSLIPDMPIKGVLLHQAKKNHSMFLKTDWFINVIKLLGTDPNSTQVLFYDDLVDTSLHNQKGSAAQSPLCVQHAVILDRKANEDRSMQREFFSDARSAVRLKERALIALGLPNGMLHRPPGRVASMLIRSDKQGIANQNEINIELKRYLTDRCWHLRVVPPFEKPMHLKDQFALFASTDLSISVHGAHLTNLVWQPLGSGVLIIEKCGFQDEDFSVLANQSGIAVYRSRQYSCQIQGMAWQPKIKGGKHIHELVESYRPVFETDLKPALDEALSGMESMYYRGPRCVKT